MSLQNFHIQTVMRLEQRTVCKAAIQARRARPTLSHGALGMETKGSASVSHLRRVYCFGSTNLLVNKALPNLFAVVVPTQSIRVWRVAAA